MADGKDAGDRRASTHSQHNDATLPIEASKELGPYVGELSADLLDVPLVLLRLSGDGQHIFRRNERAPQISVALEEGLRCGRPAPKGVLQEEVNCSASEESAVQFYAGVALQGKDGVLGSLYVFDTQTRHLSEAERSRLRGVAQLTAYVLEAPHMTGRSDIQDDTASIRSPTNVYARYRHLVDNVTDAVFLTDQETGRILEANERAQQLVGRSLSELQDTYQKELHPSSNVDLLSVLRNNGSPLTTNLVVLHREGHHIPVEASASIVETSDGAAVQSIVREIAPARHMKGLQMEQGRLVEMVARGEPLEATLEALLAYIEAQVPGARAAATLLDAGGECVMKAIAPSLPAAYAAAFGGRPLDQAGPAGEAVRRQSMIRSDKAQALPMPTVARRVLEERELTQWLAVPLDALQDSIGAIVAYVPAQHRLTEEIVGLVRVIRKTAGIAATRHRAECDLRESTERWRSLVEHHPEAIVVHRQGRIAYGNAAAAELTGAEETKDLIGLSPHDFLDRDDLADVEERLAALETGQLVPLHRYNLTDLSGRRKEIEALGVPIMLQGEPAVQTVLRDVTDRRRAERALEERERQYRLIAENVSDVIVRHDPDGTCRYISPSVQRLTGRRPEALIGKAGSANIHPDDEELYTETLADLQHNEETQITCRLKHSDGHYIWVETTARAVFDDTGAVEEIFSVTRDISERVEAEKEAQMLGKAIEQAIEGILVLNRDNIVKYANPAWAEMHGYDDARALVGEPMSLFHTDEQMQHLVRPFQKQVRKHGAFEGELQHVHTDGTTFPTRLTVTQLEDGEFVATANDITVQKHYERELIHAKDEAEEMNRLKSAFLANMSHEIRTPLTGIIGLAEVLEETAEGDTGEYAQLIEMNGRRLMKTLNSVLNLAQLEGGTMKLHPSSFNFADVASEAVELFQPQAEKQGLTLHLALPDPAVVPVKMDHSAAERIVSNLVSNAVKFTGEGTVVISLRMEDADVVLEVADTGIGIPESFLPRLFQEFQQVSSGTAREYEGSGLGLTITKRLVDLLGGAIEVESTEGVGSTFTVRLPRVAGSDVTGEDATKPTESAESQGPRRSILVVEDDATTRQVIQFMLQNTYDVTTVGGMDAAMNEAHAHTFDIILLDINLGERRTGVEVMHALRELPEYDAVPIVACTAYALPGDEERFLRVGFHGYVEKPIQKQKLLDTLEQASEPGAPAGDAGMFADEEIEIEVPPMPGTLPEIIQLASSQEEVPDTERLTQVLENDPVVASRVLRQVNSAAYSLSQRISSIDRAVTMLGFDPVCDLVLTEVMKKAFSNFEEGPAAAVYDHITKMSVATAVFARALSQYLELEKPETAFSAGMLVQLGRMALLGSNPREYAALWHADDPEAKETTMTAPTLGQEVLNFGADYVGLGVRVGRQWDLSDEVLEVLRHHRDAHRRGAAYYNPLTLAASVGFTAAQNLYAPDRASDLPEHESTNALKTLEELAAASGCALNDLALFLDKQRQEVRRFVDAVC